MKQLLISLFLTAIFACGTTSKKYKDLQPLSAKEPVQMFWSIPNLKYDEVCAIEAHGNNALVMAFLHKEDFESIFASEARKCGADGVIYTSMTPVTHGDVAAFGTGIKIRSKPSSLNPEKIKTFSLAVRDHDQKQVEALIQDIPKKRDERAPSDDELINIGLYLTSLEGFSCNAEMVKLLQDDYSGKITQFSMVKSFADDEPDSNILFCQNVVTKSLPEMKDETLAVNTLQHYYAELVGIPKQKNFKKKVVAFHDSLLEASRIIVKSCEKTPPSLSCALKNEFIFWAEAQQKLKLKEIKRNATDVLAILKPSEPTP